MNNAGRSWWYAGREDGARRFEIENGFTASRELIDCLVQSKSPVVLHFDSSGGDLFGAREVAGVLETLDSTAVVSNALSAAAILARGCRRVLIHEHGHMLIHPPRCTCPDLSPDEMREQATFAEHTVAGQLVPWLSERTGQTRETVAAWFRAETLFDAPKSVAAGLADSISPGSGSVGNGGGAVGTAPTS